MSARRKRPGSVYRRGNMLWVKYVDADGAYAWKSTGCQVGQEKQAAVFLRTVIEEVAAQRRAGVRSDGPLTVARFAKTVGREAPGTSHRLRWG